MKMRASFAMLLAVGALLSACAAAPPVANQQAPSTTAPQSPAATTSVPETTAAATNATTAPSATEPATGKTASVRPAPDIRIPTDDNPRDGSIKQQPIPQGLFPVTDQKVTIRVAVPSNPNVADFTTNDFTKWYEQKTNVHVDWVVLPEKEALEKLNLMLSSGDYPDVIMGFSNITPAQLQVYGQQGIFLPLNHLIDQYGPNIRDAFTQYPSAKDVSTAPDGNIYGLPSINDCYHCSMSQKLWIYKPWLDKLGLKIPETTGEFEQVLQAFKTRDPNGNGKADELPLTTSTNGWNSVYDAYFMNSFLLNPSSHQVLQDGKIAVTYDKPEWREGLRYLHKLYQEGLIDPNSFTQDNDQLSLLGQSDPVIVGAATWGFPAFAGKIEAKPSQRWQDYVTVAPLKGPSGFRVQPNDPYGFGIGAFVITKAAKNPDIALRWADGFYQQEVELNAYYGPKGTDWQWAKPGDKGLNGGQALFALPPPPETTASGPQNAAWAQTNPSARSSDWRLGQAVTNPNDLEIALYRETKKLEPYAQEPKAAVPPLFLTADQSQEVGELQTTITKYVSEMFARFVTGDADIESEWDTYIQTLNAQGLPKLLKIQQAVYDAKYKH